MGRLKSALRQAMQRRGPAREGKTARISPIGQEPGDPTAFELVTRRGLDDLTRQVERMETKINGLLIALASSILIDLYRTLAR